MMGRKVYTLYSEQISRIILTVWRDTIFDGFCDDDGCVRLISVVRGEGSISSGDWRESYSSGDAFIFDSGKSFSFDVGDETEIFLLKFNISDFVDADFKVFKKETVTGLLMRIEGSCSKLGGVHINSKKIQSSLYFIENELADKNACSAFVVKAYMGLVTALTVQYLYDEIEDSGLNRTSHYKSVEKSLVYINENISEKITLDELAQVAGMGKTGYSVAFKSVTGMTVWEYILNARVELASKYLMEKESVNVTEISMMCGFNNNAHFAKVFKKLKGSTPSEFKRNSNNPCF